MMHSNWRDCDAWRQQNLPMNTTSNEAAKLYDVCVSQLIGWYENFQFGGLISSLNKMVESDPDFVLGHCLKNGIELLGTNSLICSTEQRNKVNDLILKTNNLKNLSNREKLHVNAIESLQYGDLPKAIDYWEEVLVENPTDIMAIKFLHSGYFYTGKSKEMRDSVARVLPQWKSDLPHFSYLYGLYAFGLTQTGELEKAEKYAFKGLELNRFDGWASHTVAHVNEYRTSFDKGIKFMLETEKDWSTCDFISGHNNWHLCLFYLEKNDHESIMNILENNESFKNPKMTIDLVNTASLLMRLKINGFDADYTKKRFVDLKERFNDRIEHHGYAYSDSHMALIYAECGSEKEKNTYLESLNNFINTKEFHLSDFIRKLNNQVTLNLANSLFYYCQNDFEKCVDLLYPLRYELYNIGGSNAQRDVFNLVLIDSCLKSSSMYHNKIGHALLYERFADKPDSNLLKRLSDKFFIRELNQNL